MKFRLQIRKLLQSRVMTFDLSRLAAELYMCVANFYIVNSLLVVRAGTK